MLLAHLGQLGRVRLAQRLEFLGVLVGDPGELPGVPGGLGVLLLGQGVVRPPVGEGHDGADELVPVTHRRGRQVDRHLVPGLRPQHLPAHPVLAPGAQGVGERRLLVRELVAVRARVKDEGVQVLAAEIAGPVSEYLSGRRIDQNNPPLGVRPDDTLGRRAQDHLGLALRTREFGLGVDGARQIAYDEHEQLVRGGAVAVVGLLAVLEIRTGDLDRELGPVGPPRDHPGRLGPPVLVDGLGPPHGSRDQPGVELRQQIEQSPAHQSRARGLEGLQGDGVGVDDGPIGVDQHQRIGQRVQYGCEASSASGWPAAHETLPPCYRTLPTADAILPTGPQRVTRGSLRAEVALATPDEREVARGSDADWTQKRRRTCDHAFCPAPP